ncbi:hypothetical protein [Aliiglaciecola sp. LCG003]|uniref:hypothetical protein n=1 Tax=Aliiglaciecola sp. LCG003 TaxID=3053655 RepID=UPI0025747F13|nr:hypothetical protein [Aliiglaciecola sp. LCG003]WJG09204.1 hypothetical protein QR722_18035 [Aliiglaciecola sp. LCG003]
MQIKQYILFFTLIVSFSSAYCKTVFTYIGPESNADPRVYYVKRVLELALEKTRAEYGDYELKPTAPNVNVGRLTLQMEQKLYPNIFFKMSITDELLEQYHVIPFPVDRGATGYRVAFVHSSVARKFCPVTNKNQLKKFSIVQGIGWLDTDILKYNGLKVYDISEYQQMFGMVDKNRIDLFLRGINEIDVEMELIKNNYPSIALEPCLLVHYPLPRFFVTYKDNTTNAERVETGLKLAFEDGSFIKLWNEYYAEGIEKLQMQNRHVLELENPFIKNLGNDYLQYQYSFSIPAE